MKNLKSFFILVVILASVFARGLVASANAESISLGIDPPIFQIQAVPPANISAPLTIENRGDSALTLKISFKPFIPSDREDGQIRYVKENDANLADPLFFSYAKLIDPSAGSGQVISEFELSPKQKKDFNLSIDIPRESPQADYYFSIIFLSSPNSSLITNNSQLAAGIVSNVLLSVGVGRVTGEIAEFSAPLFLEKGPVPFTVRVKNTSSHFINPKGEILLKNIFGQTIGRVDLAQVNILANSVRNIPSEDFLEEDKNLPEELAAYWPQNFILGPYKATLSIALSDTGPLFKRNLFFFAFPIKGLVAVALGALLLTYITIKVRSKI